MDNLIIMTPPDADISLLGRWRQPSRPVGCPKQLAGPPTWIWASPVQLPPPSRSRRGLWSRWVAGRPGRASWRMRHALTSCRVDTCPWGWLSCCGRPTAHVLSVQRAGP